MNLNKYNIEFHHLGLAVKNPEKTTSFLKGLGYEMSSPIFDELQQVSLIMCSHDEMPDIEIIYSSVTPSPIDLILKESNESLYHQCYTSKNVAKTLEAIKNDGFRVLNVSPQKEAILFSNKKVSFYYIKHFGLIELLEINE